MLTTLVSMWLCGAALLGLALCAKRAARAQDHARVHVRAGGRSVQPGRARARR